MGFGIRNRFIRVGTHYETFDDNDDDELLRYVMLLFYFYFFLIDFLQINVHCPYVRLLEKEISNFVTFPTWDVFVPVYNGFVGVAYSSHFYVINDTFEFTLHCSCQTYFLNEYMQGTLNGIGGGVQFVCCWQCFLCKIFSTNSDGLLHPLVLYDYVMTTLYPAHRKWNRKYCIYIL